jgi:asparagine synthase (glutamine-hydrolysing)
MLACRIAARDLERPWRRVGKRWVAGESVVAPYEHPALESYAFVSERRTAVVVRERLGGAGISTWQPRPQLSPTEFDEAIVRATEWPLDVLVVTIAPDAGTPLQMQAGASGTAPIYLMTASDTLWGHWDAACLYGRMSGAVDYTRAAYVLVKIGTPYSRRTLFPDLLMLTERSRAEWRPPRRSLAIRYPPARPSELARRLVEDADVLGAFEDLFAAALARSIAGERPVAVELSGGLDSSAATAVLARRFADRDVRTYGLIMPGDNGEAQAARRSEVVSRFGVRDTAIPADDYPPFAAGERSPDDAMVPWGEYYHEAFRALLQRMRGDGCASVVRGIGGDEISGLRPNEIEAPGLPAAGMRVQTVPAFLTRRAIEAFRAAEPLLDPAPAGGAARSFYEAQSAGATLCLREGIWPRYPYGTHELVAFCRSLPPEWRRRRTLQRRYLAACGLSSAVTHPSPRETFLPLRDLAMRQRSASFVETLFTDSRLAALGLIDRDALQRSYSRYRADASWPEADSLFEAAALEQTLRAVERARRPDGAIESPSFSRPAPGPAAL